MDRYDQLCRGKLLSSVPVRCNRTEAFPATAASCQLYNTQLGTAMWLLVAAYQIDSFADKMLSSTLYW